MVGLLRRGPRGVLGKLSGDPAVATAAVALLCGWSDPLDLLALDADDYAIAVAVVNEAEKLRSQRDKAAADYQAAKNANLTAEGILRGLKRMLGRR